MRKLTSEEKKAIRERGFFGFPGFTNGMQISALGGVTMTLWGYEKGATSELYLVAFQEGLEDHPTWRMEARPSCEHGGSTLRTSVYATLDECEAELLETLRRSEQRGSKVARCALRILRSDIRSRVERALRGVDACSLDNAEDFARVLDAVCAELEKKGV